MQTDSGSDFLFILFKIVDITVKTKLKGIMGDY